MKDHTHSATFRLPHYISKFFSDNPNIIEITIKHVVLDRHIPIKRTMMEKNCQLIYISKSGGTMYPWEDDNTNYLEEWLQDIKELEPPALVEPNTMPAIGDTIVATNERNHKEGRVGRLVEMTDTYCLITLVDSPEWSYKGKYWKFTNESNFHEVKPTKTESIENRHIEVSNEPI